MTKFNYCIFFILGSIFLFSQTIFAQEITDQDQKIVQHLKTCAFEVEGTANVEIGKSDLREERTNCSILLNFKKIDLRFGKSSPIVAGGTLGIEKIPSDHDDLLGYLGFRKNKKNKWIFDGYRRLLKPSHFKRLVAIEFPDANGITLVGKQTETGYISQGEIDQNSTFIFRKMPDYLIEVEITFEFSVSPKKLMN